MKKINYLFVLLAIFSIVVFGCTSQTQTGKNTGDAKKADGTMAMPDGTMMEKEGEMMVEEGFEMINDKMLTVNEKTKAQTAMEKDVVLNDGTKVMTDGKVIRKDGTTFMLKEGESIWMDGSFMKAGEMMEKEENMMKKDGSMLTSFTGKVLAGTTSKYLEFKKADYDKALNENKIIFLDFYADWCPVCQKEKPGILAAFNELNNENIVGYQVHFNDGQTTEDDKEMAKKYGITYQHTKVIIGKDGKVALKSLEFFSKETAINEINKVIGN